MSRPMYYELIIYYFYAPLLPVWAEEGHYRGIDLKRLPLFRDLIATGRHLEYRNVFCILRTYTECVKSPPSIFF